MSSLEDWHCPVCRDMLCKPVVNACGHVFCFWCVHRAMDGLGTSHCPLCRADYTHLAAPCTALSEHLARTFPAEYAKRLRENLDEEEANAYGNSPDIPASVVLGGDARDDDDDDDDATPLEGRPLFDALEGRSPTPSPDASTFECCYSHDADVVSKAEPGPHAAWEPVVLLCGCVACKGCHARRSDGARCPRCRRRVVRDDPEVCILMHEVIQRSAFAEEAREGAARRAEEAREGAARLAEEKLWSFRSGSRSTSSADEEQPPAPRLGNLPGRGRVVNPLTFTHLGVGCDVCGVYPIRGRRYHCKDCPREQGGGFDMCQACYELDDADVAGEIDIGGAVIRGRFNQTHRPGHQMQEVAARPTLLHFLQDVHPELSPAQILDLVQLGISREEGGGGGGDGEANAVNAAVDAAVDAVSNIAAMGTHDAATMEAEAEEELLGETEIDLLREISENFEDYIPEDLRDTLDADDEHDEYERTDECDEDG